MKCPNLPAPNNLIFCQKLLFGKVIINIYRILTRKEKPVPVWTWKFVDQVVELLFYWPKRGLIWRISFLYELMPEIHIIRGTAICRNPHIQNCTGYGIKFDRSSIYQYESVFHFHENTRRNFFFCGSDISTEGVFVTELSGNRGIFDELCGLRQIAVSWVMLFLFLFFI